MIVRIGILFIIALFLLPTDPSAVSDSTRYATNGDSSFCERYPHTCAAGGELFSAAKYKLVYAVALARQSLQNSDQPAGYNNATNQPPTSNRRGEWLPPGFIYGASRSDRQNNRHNSQIRYPCN